jgi:hypothetical protein
MFGVDFTPALQRKGRSSAITPPPFPALASSLDRGRTKSRIRKGRRISKTQVVYPRAEIVIEPAVGV